MATPVHLQYNSPMQLYSKESAEEQFTQQIGAAPVGLPAPDKHFDPSKSATLKYLQEGDHGEFGENFFDKIAAAEAPRAPLHQEPGWARYAREKSERARSKTPADPSQHHTPSATPAPLNHPVHHETAREHYEKNKVFTNTNQPQWGPAYYQLQESQPRRGHSEGREYFDRGYECGGMDYTKGMQFQDQGDQDYYYSEHRSRKEEQERRNPGYEMGGTDFGKGYISAGPYHGHGPDPPRLRPKYDADPHSQCNAFIAPNVDAVDANLLVGDTLSNQKIKHEVRQIDQSEYGTSFAPPGGFKRDHQLIRRHAGPPEPVTFCVSAPTHRSASAPRTSAPSYHQNFWTERQANVDKEVTIPTLLNDSALERRETRHTPFWESSSLQKQESWKHRSDPRLDRQEVYTTEPNWSRTVEQRKNAWERKAYDTEARVQLPASAKVAPDAPPTWHNRAEKTHNIWQNAADNMYSNQHQRVYNTEVYQQPPQQQQSFNQSSQNYYSSSQNAAPSSRGYVSSTNAENVVNSGYNRNQMEYVMKNQNKYQGGNQYAARTAPVQNYSTSSYQTQDNRMGQGQNLSSSTAIPVGPAQNYSSSSYQMKSEESRSAQPQPATTTIPLGYSTETRIQGQHSPQPAQRQPQANYSQQEERVAQQNFNAMAPLSPIQTNFESAQDYSSSRTAQNYPAVQTGGQQMYSSSHHSESKTTQQAPPMLSPAASYKSYSSSHYSKQEKTSSNTTGGGLAPQVTTTLPVTQNTSYSYSTKSTSAPTQPVNITQDSYTSHTEKTSSNTAPQPVAQPINTGYSMDNYHKSSHLEQTREESRPVSQLSQYSESRNYKKNYEEKTETRTIPATLPASYGTTETADVFNKKIEMSESLPHGSLSNTHNNTQGGYRDKEGHDVSYKRELTTAANPGKEYALLKEEEKRVVETPLEPGVISRHVTTKYYKKKTVTDSTTTTVPQ